MNGIEDEASLKSDVKKEEKQSAGDESKQQ